jgi:hypothetical protein
MQKILAFSNIYEQKYIFADVNTVKLRTLFFANFFEVEILKQVLIDLMVFPVRERKFRIHFNFYVTYLHLHRNWTPNKEKIWQSLEYRDFIFPFV